MRRLEVLQMFKKEKNDILMLQETNTNQPCEDEWRRIFKGCLFFSSAFEDSKAGVAIIVYPRIQALEIYCMVVCKGFLIAVELISSNQKICIIHVYCPSDSAERILFLPKLAGF